VKREYSKRILAIKHPTEGSLERVLTINKYPEEYSPSTKIQKKVVGIEYSPSTNIQKKVVKNLKIEYSPSTNIQKSMHGEYSVLTLNKHPEEHAW